MSRASPPRHLADHDPVGAHAQGISDQLADRNLALALDVGGPRLERDDVLLAKLELGGILDGDDPLVGGDEATRARSAVVVLPEPVPPETKMLSRPATHARRKSNISAVRVPNSDQVLHGQRLTANFRIVTGPDEGERRDDGVDARAVGQPRIHHRRGLVHAAGRSAR